MRYTLALPLIAVLAAVSTAVAPTAATAAPVRYTGQTLRTTATRGDVSVSSNWAGYAVTGTEADGTPTSFTSVTARWVQPRANCTRRGPTFSAFWIGLGGDSQTSSALEQIGTSADCSIGGVARYSMWYELVPAPPVTIKLKVKPGNLVAALVKVDASAVTLQIKNLTRKTSATRTLTIATPDVSSAEWVAEAPSTCDASGQCRPLPLTNFGHVAFSHIATTTATGHSGTLADPTWTASPIELVEADPSLLSYWTGQEPSGAIPGDPSPDGTSFAVAWAKAVTPPPAP